MAQCSYAKEVIFLHNYIGPLFPHLQNEWVNRVCAEGCIVHTLSGLDRMAIKPNALYSNRVTPNWMEANYVAELCNFCFYQG